MNALQLATKIKNNPEWKKAYDCIANAKSHRQERNESLSKFREKVWH
ncbi:MAG: hypothetical protein ACLSIL_19875 [Enterococcus casseliflavus]